MQLTAPADGATLSGAASLAASASDDIGVTKVEFYRGTTLIGTATSSPYQLSWDTTTVANGSYTLTAKAYAAAGTDPLGGGERDHRELVHEPAQEPVAGDRDQQRPRLLAARLLRLQHRHLDLDDRRPHRLACRAGADPTSAPAIANSRQAGQRHLCADGQQWNQIHARRLLQVEHRHPLHPLLPQRRRQLGLLDQSPTFATTTSWAQATWTTPPVPAGATHISFGLGITAVGTLTQDDLSLVVA